MTVRTGPAAGAWARGQVGKAEFHLMCKAFVRTAFQVEPSRSRTAIECFHEAQHKHPVPDPDRVPAFVPVFMDTSASAEHVVITVGRDSQGHRLCVSTDAGPGSTIGLVRLGQLIHDWGPALGWTEDMDGQRVWTPPPTPRPDRIYEIAREIVNRTPEGGLKHEDFQRVARIARRWSNKY